MTDYLRKPAIGTTARVVYDERRRRSREPCQCGSGRPANPFTKYETCLACDPATKDRLTALTGGQNGNNP